MTLYPEKQIKYASRQLRFEAFEHFLNFPLTSGAVCGAMGLSPSLASGTVSIAGSDATHPGVMRFSTAASATGRAAIATNLNAFLLGSGAFEVEYSFKLSSVLSSATDTYTAFMGFTDSVSGIGANTAGLFYSLSNANFLYVCRKAASETAILSNLAADLNWHVLNININKAATIATFTLDNLAPLTISTNVPNTNRMGLGLYILKSVGTVARTLDIDYKSIKVDFT